MLINFELEILIPDEQHLQQWWFLLFTVPPTVEERMLWQAI